ncbi:hypothetical protein FOXYS1_993, partial [Fusarium oxysporum]
MELADLSLLDYPSSEGPTPCGCLVTLLRDGKLNKTAKKEFMGALRHKDPLFCTQGALAQLFFWRWHVAGEPSPSFRRRQDWYRIKVLVGRDREQELSYPTQLQETWRIFGAAGLMASKKTHLPRRSVYLSSTRAVPYRSTPNPMESNDIMLPSPPSAFALLRPPRNLASQFELTTHTALPDHPTVADLPRAIWRNKRYVLEESLSRKGSKGRKSWIKRHGLFLIEIDTNDSPLSPYWACRLCDAKGQPEFFAAAATSSAADHLRKSHRIFESSQAADPDQSTDESERPKRRRLQYSTVPRARVKTIRELSLGLLINTNVPFSFFSDTFFQQLAWQLDPHLADQIPWSRQSMGRLLDDTYKSKKDEIKQELSDALTKIHLGFDLWTSPNRHAVMALGCHSGENLAVTLGQIVREWKIKDRVGTVISDNASSNDSCLVNFYGDLDAEMSATDVRARRMRCYGHILNLVARAFLYGEDFEAFEAESQVFDLLGRRGDDLRHWRKKGPVGKLHNVVKFIRSSPQRCELFKRISRENDEAQEYLLASESTGELEVVMNNDTRWNSTYLVISRALVKQGDIRAFLVHPEVEKWLPEADMLKGDDWRLLTEVKHIHEPFYLQTMRMQGWGSEGGNGRLWEVMTGMEYLLEHLEDRKLFYHAPEGDQTEIGSFQLDPGIARWTYILESKPSGSSGIDDMGKDHRRYLRLSIITAWQKLNEYYTRLGESLFFAASIILYPSLGMSYLEVNWVSEEQLVRIMDAKIGLSDYLDRCVPQRTPVDSMFKQSVKSKIAKTTVMESEFERYLRLEPQETEDPIEWWMVYQGQFPMSRQVDVNVAEAFGDDGNIGEVAMPEELGQTCTMKSIETLRVAKYVKYDPGFDLFDLRAALVGAQDAETHGTSLAQISQAGRWNQSVLCQAYLPHLPRQFMRIVA